MKAIIQDMYSIIIYLIIIYSIFQDIYKSVEA